MTPDSADGAFRPVLKRRESRSLSVGDPAPDFRLPLAQGGELALSDLRGHRVLLVFLKGMT